MFKEYAQNQALLFPPDISDMVPEDHLARVINDVVDSLDIRCVTKQYSPLGQNGFHPRMLLKVLFYGYATGVRSSRKLDEKLREDVIYMWLSGMQKVDFRTLALFRQQRINEIKKLFVEIVNICAEMGMVKIGRVFIDGTKIEANANGHRMLYAKMLEKRERNIEQKMKELLDEAEQNDQKENKKYRGKKGKDLPHNLQKKANRLHKLKEAQKRVKEQKKILRERSNCSMTDKDANLMKIKRDYAYPGYNMQLATNNQVIVNYHTTNKCHDASSLKPHIKEIRKNLKKKPEMIIADAGYGTEENYTYLKKEKINELIPYPTLEKERTKSYRTNKYRRENFLYDKKTNTVTCPEGHTMPLIYEGPDFNKRGRHIKEFRSEICSACPGRIMCTAGENRKYKYREPWEKIKKKIKEKLSQGWAKSVYAVRKMDVEAVIGNIKYNMGFRKFLLRGLDKVNIETGLTSIAHNLRKVFTFKQKFKYGLARDG